VTATSRYTFTSDRDGATAKFWLSPVRLARNIGFNARELNVLEAKVVEQQVAFSEASHGYFGRPS
jgi:hypothetical protein